MRSLRARRAQGASRHIVHIVGPARGISMVPVTSKPWRPIEGDVRLLRRLEVGGQAVLLGPREALADQRGAEALALAVGPGAEHLEVPVLLAGVALLASRRA